MNDESPYLIFNRKEWCSFKQNTPLMLTDTDIAKLQGQTEVVSLSEINDIYLPLSRLLSLHVMGSQALHHVANQFLGKQHPKVPYIIGIAGSVAVGKSTTSRVLQALLSQWPSHPHVAIITTDSFLYSLSELEKRGLLQKKGFPESYCIPLLLKTLNDIKTGKDNISIPIYSHHLYDIIPHQKETIKKPDIVIIEGINILQTRIHEKKPPKLFVSDFFDFSIFVDADTNTIKKWYVDRVLRFCQGPFQDKKAYFNFLTKLSKTKVVNFANKIWHSINEINLIKNILPYKYRADIILRKGKNHRVQKVLLRKL